LSFRWVEKGDPESSFSAYQFSDGTLRFIALATVLLQPDPPEVIIIDEPELGLHPKAIKKLAGMVEAASEKTQIIISTQSVNLVDCFDPEQIITVDRNEEENQSVFKRLRFEDMGLWLDDFKMGELWERNIINSAQPYSK
jgi:predicted ATPase